MTPGKPHLKKSNAKNDARKAPLDSVRIAEKKTIGRRHKRQEERKPNKRAKNKKIKDAYKNTTSAHSHKWKNKKCAQNKKINGAYNNATSAYYRLLRSRPGFCPV